MLMFFEYIKFIFFVGLSNIGSDQHKVVNNDVDQINQFIEILQSSDYSMKVLFEKDIILAEETFNDKGESSYEMYQLILESLAEEIKNCQNSQENLKIISFSDVKKSVLAEFNLNIPSEGSVYFLFCNDHIITSFLIKENHIVSFSMLNKGGKRFFLSVG